MSDEDDFLLVAPDWLRDDPPGPPDPAETPKSPPPRAQPPKRQPPTAQPPKRQPPRAQSPKSPPPKRQQSTVATAPAFRPIRWLVPVLLVLLAGGVYVLAREGAAAFLDSRGGQVAEQIVDPTAPGFEAVVEPTPSLLVAIAGDDGSLAGLTVISLAAQDTGGTVLIVPSETEFGLGGATLAGAFIGGGPDRFRISVAELLNTNFGAIEVLDDARFAQVLADLAPIEVSLADDLFALDDDGRTVVRFASGTVLLAPGDVADFLGWVNPGENPINQIVRQEAFWVALVDRATAVAATAPEGVAAMSAERFVAALGAGPTEIITAPGSIISSEATTDDLAIYRVDAEELAPVVDAMFPFRVSPTPGALPRIRLIDGVGDRARLLAFAAELAGDGAQIVIVGNAQEFGVADSRVVRHTGEFTEAAQRFAATLGLDPAAIETDFVADELADTEGAASAIIDLTIVVGADAAPEGTG